MDQKYNSLMVFTNPYLLEKIVAKLDIRTLFKCHTISKEFFDAVQYEYESRKDIVHLYLLRHDSSIEYKDIEKLNQSFISYTKLWLNIRPSNVLLFIGGYHHTIDYRLRQYYLKHLSQHLPKDCVISYIDVGNSILTSSIRFKSLTNYEDHQNRNELVQRTAFPCMSCLLFPQIDGIVVNAYNDVKQVNIESVKCLLYFQAVKHRKHNNQSFNASLSSLNELIKSANNNMAFGGGCPKAIKSMSNNATNGDILRKHLIITFGGNRVKSSSVVLSTANKSEYHQQLISFKSVLDFNCDDISQSTTVAFLFANTDNFSPQFTLAFQSVFPFVGIFGFQSNQQMFGHFYCTANKSQNLIIEQNNLKEHINPKTNSVLVIINFSIKNISQ